MPDLLSKWSGKSTHFHKPLQASLELTNRCNERCGHCYIDDFSDDAQKKLTKDQWFDILHKLRDAGILYLILMGGEAMMSPYFWDILKKACDMGFHVSMITNGLKIKSLDVAKRLKDDGLSLVTMSLYSAHQETHDAMTKVSGSHARTLKAIDFLLATQIEVTLNCLLTKDNIDTIFDLYDYAKMKNLMLKVDYNITPKLSGNLYPTKLRATKKQLQRYFLELIKQYPHAGPSPSGENESSYICNAAKGKCAVTAYGDLLACIEIRKPLGSLLNTDFATAWESEEAKKWRNLRVKDMEGLDSIEVQNFCDHCPGLSDHEHGNHLKMTDFANNVAHLKRDIWKSCCK